LGHVVIHHHDLLSLVEFRILAVVLKMWVEALLVWDLRAFDSPWDVLHAWGVGRWILAHSVLDFCVRGIIVRNVSIEFQKSASEIVAVKLQGFDQTFWVVEINETDSFQLAGVVSADWQTDCLDGTVKCEQSLYFFFISVIRDVSDEQSYVV
jgi:hypothetical protein